MNTQKKILVVEDDSALQTALVEKLRREGFRVASAGDGEEGLKIALATKPDLILLDLFMPKMDGATMMDHLRQDLWGKKVPIIILTNFDPDDKMTGKIAEDKPSYYFLKTDIQLDELVERIRGIFNSNSEGSE